MLHVKERTIGHDTSQPPCGKIYVEMKQNDLLLLISGSGRWNPFHGSNTGSQKASDGTNWVFDVLVRRPSDVVDFVTWSH